MKINKGLFEKKIDLKSCQINGGKMAFGTMSDCQVRTGTTSCPDTHYTYYNDDGSIRSTRTVYNLSNSID
ncbi:hypothetical protein [Pedobacter panaciterrae]|jgi:hypothetical protein|uniref:Peptide modification target (TIGR04139 family) n=1 Tax=Pedobacter panaciterrae TaxID=363849 RepID=A0ABU8NMC2_9SPHI|nr:hypothetical protein [Pedobacter panaciterrae]NQX53028.1 hypothetical protein [Pedobacter panaciterrae]